MISQNYNPARTDRHLAKALRHGKLAGLTKAECDHIADIIDEAIELEHLAYDRRYSSELIGIRVRNTFANGQIPNE